MNFEDVWMAFVILLIVGIIATPILLDTIKPKKGFTEIYFSEVASKRNPQLFGFTIFNKENRRQIYVYEVFHDQDGDETILKRGAFSLGTYQKVEEKVSVPAYESGKIGVRLLGRDQSIHFWI